jgi:UDP-N-acetylmuramoyl-L-alanyl-D-glutamate--2,6-diaminopimelate ligase
MLFSELIKAVPVVKFGGAPDAEVRDVVNDSRGITPGAVFVAVGGMKTDGARFITKAVEQGAAAIVSESEPADCPVAWAQVANSREAVGLLARRLWNDPTVACTMVGITGTNGKTTTAYLYHNLFKQLYGTQAAWMFGTVIYICGDVYHPASHTTPEAAHILRMVGQATSRPRGLAMEVSSHSLHLDRIAGLSFDLAVWSNLTQDHLDYHKTMEEYYKAKKRLFTQYLRPGATAVINIDDIWGTTLSTDLQAVNQLTYGRGAQAGCRILEAHCTWDGTVVTIGYAGGRRTYRSRLTGGFNVDNMTALIAGALAIGIDPTAIQKCFDTMPQVPGRMERVSVAREYSVVVDYAHTPDALEKVLTAARALTKGRLLCVFGCGGDRDRAKRPLMAQAVARHCDEAIVTSDNPRSEDPHAIIAEILTGMPLDFPHTVAADRRTAINDALAMGRPNDCIVIAGKGHEDYQEINGVRHHFDDREVVRQLVADEEVS